MCTDTYPKVNICLTGSGLSLCCRVVVESRNFAMGGGGGGGGGRGIWGRLEKKREGRGGGGGHKLNSLM